MVARFDSEESAREAAEDLRAFFDEASPLAQGRPKKTMKDVKAKSFPATDKMDALAQAHDFDWSQLLITGVYDDELELLIEGRTLLAFHPYCLGLGSDLPKYLAAKGAAQVEPGTASLPTVSVRFRWPEDADQATDLRDELTKIFAQADAHESLRDWELRPPWWENEPPIGGSVLTAFFCDHTRAGFYMPVVPFHVERLKGFLNEKKVRDLRIRLCEYADLSTFRTIARARCSHCESKPALHLVDKEEHGIESDQLACNECGGMFSLDLLIG
jgi:hypothetical protein